MKDPSTHMFLPVSSELVALAKSIVEEELTVEDWRAIESDDMFQSTSFQAGFDATEDAFTFSYWDETKREWWFQLTVAEVGLIYEGALKGIHIRLAQ